MNGIFLEKNRERILAQYEELKKALPERMAEVDAEISKWEDNTALACKYMYITCLLYTSSRMLAGVWMLFCMKDSTKVLHVRTILGLRFKGKTLRKILHLGIPCSLENSMFQLGKIMVLSLVSGFGTASIAANAVSNSVCALSLIHIFIRKNVTSDQFYDFHKRAFLI